ncbi:hypothetical protein [Azospirillum argentinense]
MDPQGCACVVVLHRRSRFAPSSLGWRHQGNEVPWFARWLEVTYSSVRWVPQAVLADCVRFRGRRTA